MKKLLFAILIFGLLPSCNNQGTKTDASVSAKDSTTRPGVISKDEALKMIKQYGDLHADSLIDENGRNLKTPNSRSIWISLDRLNEMVYKLDQDSVKNKITSNGVRVYFASYSKATANGDFDSSWSYKTTLIFVSTRQLIKGTDTINRDYYALNIKNKLDTGFVITNINDVALASGTTQNCDDGAIALCGGQETTVNVSNIVSGTISWARARVMNAFYRKYHQHFIKNIQGQIRPTSTSVWFSKGRLKAMVNQLNKDRMANYSTDGTRIYFATYGDNSSSRTKHQKEYSFYNTLVLISTKKQGNAHVDYYADESTKKTGASGLALMLDDPENKGELCPPGDCCQAGATLYCGDDDPEGLPDPEPKQLTKAIKIKK